VKSVGFRTTSNPWPPRTGAVRHPGASNSIAGTGL
jgi:hypothetical protein